MKFLHLIHAVLVLASSCAAVPAAEPLNLAILTDTKPIAARACEPLDLRILAEPVSVRAVEALDLSILGDGQRDKPEPEKLLEGDPRQAEKRQYAASRDIVGSVGRWEFRRLPGGLVIDQYGLTPELRQWWIDRDRLCVLNGTCPNDLYDPAASLVPKSQKIADVARACGISVDELLNWPARHGGQRLVVRLCLKGCPPCDEHKRKVGAGDSSVHIVDCAYDLIPKWITSAPTFFNPANGSTVDGYKSLAELKEWVSATTLGASQSAARTYFPPEVKCDFPTVTIDIPHPKFKWTSPQNKTLMRHLLDDAAHAGKYDAEALAAMSRDQLERLHAADHEGLDPVAKVSRQRRGTLSISGVTYYEHSDGVYRAKKEDGCDYEPSKAAAPVYQQPAYQSGGCPGGVCPTNRVSVFRLFRRG